MKTSPSFTDLRTRLSHQFFTLRTDALREARWARLTGKNTRLASFPVDSAGRKFLGTEIISLEQIVGSLNRQDDFDHSFRPLNKHLRDHWINVFLTVERDGWPPICLHKFGEHYYVEDGHFRVSIAHALGKTFIQAQVWEHEPVANDGFQCPTDACLQPEDIYASVSE